MQEEAALPEAAAAPSTQEDQGGSSGPQGMTNSWPRANLQQLLRMDSADSTALSASGSSHSRKGDADLPGDSSCSSSPRAQQLVSQQPPQPAEVDHTPLSSEDSPPVHQQQQGAASRFSFPAAGEQTVPLQYITPLKIPQPPNKTAGHAAGGFNGQHLPQTGSSSRSRSSSPAGSYVQGLHQQAQPGKRGGAHYYSNRPGAAGQAEAQPFGGRQPVSRPSSSPGSRMMPTPSAASSMSSEAAALLHALKLAAEQRKITQGVLTARSSMASGLGTDAGPASAEQQQTPTSALHLVAATGARNNASGTHHAEAAAAAGAAAGVMVTHAGMPPPPPAPAHHQGKKQLQLSAAHSPLSSPLGSSVQGPEGPLPRSPSLLLLQRSAAERLLQEAVDSSSFSSLMALLDSAAGSEEADDDNGEEEEVLQRRPPQQQEEAQGHHHQQQPQQPHRQSMAVSGSPGRHGPPDAASYSNTAGQRHGPTAPVAAAAGGPGVAAAAAVNTAQPGLTAQPMSRRTSVVDNTSAWGSCFSTPLAGNSTANTPRQHHSGARQADPAVTDAMQQQLQEQDPHAAPQHPVHAQPQLQQQQPGDDEGCGGAVRGSQPPASPPLSSNVSWAASELVSDALSAELEQLYRQIEEERQQLEYLQTPRTQLERTVLQAAAPQTQQQQNQQLPSSCRETATQGGSSPEAGASATAGQGANVQLAPALATMQQGCGSADAFAAAAGEEGISPQSVYLECCAEPLPEARADAQAPLMADAAVQCDDTSRLPQQASAVCVDAACQALLLHMSDLPAVGPPIQCRACPLLHKQLQETQDRLELVLEQHKQVRCHGEWGQ